jgi:hypothetical protein
MSDHRDPTATRWVRSPEALWRYASDTLVVLPKGGQEQNPMVVSGSAVPLWELLATPVTLSELAHRLSQLCDRSPQVIAADLGPLLEQLNTLAAVQTTNG